MPEHCRKQHSHSSSGVIGGPLEKKRREKTQEVTMKRYTSPRRSKTMWNLSDFSTGVAFFSYSVPKIMSYLATESSSLLHLKNKNVPSANGKAAVCTQAGLLQPSGSVARTLSFHGLGKQPKGKLCNCADFEV